MTIRYTPLAVVRHRIVAGTGLPFNVFNHDRTLLLAKGQTVQGTSQLEALFERGTLVDLAELYRDPISVRHAPAELLPTLWSDGFDRLSGALQRANSSTFRAAMDEASEPVLALIERDPDLAIFQILRQEQHASTEYGLNHSVHTAIVAQLVAGRLGWEDEERTRAFKAALTMNISMLELQGVLATQDEPPSDRQRREIHTHPVRSREMLELAGVADNTWLDAVEQHHEEPDGSGYPYAINDPSELATLLHRADMYAAKLSSRVGRDAMPADRAGREIFMRDPSNPITAALVKELGVYPPGCFVALASGETGIVVKRGRTVMAPIVAAMTNRYGEPLSEPVRRDTAQALYAVVGVLPAKAVPARVPTERLMAIAAD